MDALTVSESYALSLEDPADHYGINPNCTAAVAIIIRLEPQRKQRQRFESPSSFPVKLGIPRRAFWEWSFGQEG